MILKLCYNREKTSRREYILKYYVFRLHINQYPKVNSLFLLYNKRPQADSTMRQSQKALVLTQGLLYSSLVRQSW